MIGAPVDILLDYFVHFRFRVWANANPGNPLPSSVTAESSVRESRGYNPSQLPSTVMKAILGGDPIFGNPSLSWSHLIQVSRSLTPKVIIFIHGSTLPPVICDSDTV